MKYEKGMKWNKLTLISDLSGGLDFKSSHKSVFMCDCGLNHFATLNNVSRSVVKFCPACSSAKKSKNKKTHGNSISYRERDPRGYNCYTRWQSMKRRCNNPNDKRFADYGGRGIKVCGRWLDSYDNFLADMGLPPEVSYQIDRIDNNLGYSKENCRWVTRIDNARNKRNSRLIEISGETKTMAKWSEISGVAYHTLKARLNSGVSPERAIIKEPIESKYIYQTPSGEFDSLSAAAKSVNMSISGISSRFASPNYKEWVKYERT